MMTEAEFRSKRANGFYETYDFDGNLINTGEKLPKFLGYLLCEDEKPGSKILGAFSDGRDADMAIRRRGGGFIKQAFAGVDYGE